MNTSPSLSAVSSQRKGRRGIFVLQDGAAGADLDDERALGREVVARLGKDAAHQIEAVRAAGMGDLGLGRILGGKRRHGLPAHIGGIGDDEVVAVASMGGEEVRAGQPDPLLQAVVADVAAGDGKGVLGDVAGIDPCLRERQRGQNGKATRACAQLQHGADRRGIGSRAAIRPRRPILHCTITRRYRSAGRSPARRHKRNGPRSRPPSSDTRRAAGWRCAPR